MAAVTRLGLYGGPRSPYGSFAGKTAQVIVAASTTEGGGKSKRRKYPRWVLVGDSRARVNSPDEERQLLAAMMDRAEAQVIEAVTPAEVKQANTRVVRIQKRIEKVDDREAQWVQRLREMDEEILLLVD